MELNKGVAVSAAAFFLVFAIGVVIASQPAAAFWFLGDDQFEPPQNDFRFDLDGGEYVSMWGRTSTLLEDVDTEEEAIEEMNDAFSEFAVSSTEGADAFVGFFRSGVNEDTPRTAQLEWNRNQHRFNPGAVEPVRGEAVDDLPQIENAYIQILRPSPHTVYAFDDELTRYVGDQTMVATVSNVRGSSRSGEIIDRQWNENRTHVKEQTYRWYFLQQTEAEDVTIQAESGGEVVDEQSADQLDQFALLDLSELNHSDDVTFSVEGEAIVPEVVEERRYDYRECDIGNYSSECTEETTLSEETVNHSVELSDELGGYTKYNPTVDVFYTSETEPDDTDSFYMDIRSDGPIDSVETPGDTIDYNMVYFNGRDTQFDDRMGDITPINHYAMPSSDGAEMVRDDDPRDETSEVFQTEGETQSSPPGDIRDDFVFQLDSEDYQISPDRVTAFGSTSIGEPFTEGEVQPQSILPDEFSPSVEVNFHETDDVEFINTNLQAQFSEVDADSLDQRVSISLYNTSGEPIDTSEKDGLSVEVENQRSGESEILETDSDGHNETVMEARAGDVIEVHLNQADFTVEDEKLYIAEPVREAITPDINYVNTVNSIMYGVVVFIINRILPLALLLSVINYGFTGQFLPDSIKEMLSVG